MPTIPSIRKFSEKLTEWIHQRPNTASHQSAALCSSLLSVTTFRYERFWNMHQFHQSRWVLSMPFWEKFEICRFCLRNCKSFCSLWTRLFDSLFFWLSRLWWCLPSVLYPPFDLDFAKMLFLKQTGLMSWIRPLKVRIYPLSVENGA